MPMLLVIYLVLLLLLATPSTPSGKLEIIANCKTKRTLEGYYEGPDVVSWTSSTLGNSHSRFVGFPVTVSVA